MAGTMVVAATVPAVAAPRLKAVKPAAHAAAPAAPAGHAKAAAAHSAAPANDVPTVIGSELDKGKYATIVNCHGVDSPPPVTLGKPGTPLTVNGIGPSAAILATLKHPNPYKTIYVCTVTVKEKVPPKPKAAVAGPAVRRTGCEIAGGGGTGGPGGGPGGGPSGGHKTCAKPVTLNTGYGGLASQVKGHHPAG
jgi:hypothetical protein